MAGVSLCKGLIYTSPYELSNAVNWDAVLHCILRSLLQAYSGNHRRRDDCIKISRKTHRTAVVIIPPKDLLPTIQSIREKHDRQFRRWMPHITLLYPFRPRDQFEILSDRVHEACERIAPFTINLTGFSFFSHSERSHTFWLVPEPREKIDRLQATLLQVVPDCNDVRRFPTGFTPHLSLGQARSRTAVEHLIEGFEKEWIPIEFELSEVSMIWRGDPPDDVFRIGLSVKLGAQPWKSREI